MTMRFNLLCRGSSLDMFPCELLLELQSRNFRELWFRCEDIEDVLVTLESLLLKYRVVSIGTVSNITFRALPNTFEDFVKALTADLVVEPETDIIIKAYQNLPEVTNLLLKHSYGVKVKPRSSILKAKLRVPLNVSNLFDMGARLLKPFTVPPTLITITRGKNYVNGSVNSSL